MAGNFWDQDEIVTPAPGAPTVSSQPAQSASVVPVAQPSAPSAAAETTTTVISGQTAAEPAPARQKKNFWEDDEVVSPAPASAQPLAQQKPSELPKPQRSFVDELGHQAGLFGRAAVNGAAALPAMAADAVTAPINAGLDIVNGKGNGFRFQPQAQAVNKFMDSMGVAKPENATERVVQDATTAIGGTGATMALGKALAASSGPLSKAVGSMLTDGPLMQVTSAATSGAASGGVREAGGGEGAQLAAGVAGALLPGVAASRLKVVDPSQSQFANSAKNANEAGYVIPPADLSQNSVTQLASAVGGKIKTSQEASFRNQATSNKLAKQALGMAEDQVLDSASLAALRKDASRAYAPVANAGTVVPTQKYADALDDAVSVFSSQSKSFPNIPVPPAVGQIQSLKTGQFDAADGLNVIKVLREAADTAYRGGDKLVGSAYKKAAVAMEGALEDHLVSLGAPAADVLKSYRDARQLIAKSYTVENALNPTTGNVNAIKLAADLKKGKPLTNELRTIAEVGQAFPKATQALKEAPGKSSILDVITTLGGTAATGSAAPLAMLGARPAVRSALLSKVMQDRYVKGAGTMAAGVPSGAAAVALNQAVRADQSQKREKPMNRFQAGRQAYKNGGLIEKVDGGFIVRPAPESAATDDPAHAAATSPHNNLPEPTDGQKQAGNYKVGRIRIAGMDMSVENPEGSVRRGVDADGTPWETEMKGAHYGYLRKTQANDGDKLDVFVKPGTPSNYTGPVFVIDQVDPSTGKFDEHKTVIGVKDAAEAENLYRGNYAPDWDGLGAITKLPMLAFAAWSRSGKLKKPLGELPEVSS